MGKGGEGRVVSFFRGEGETKTKKDRRLGPSHRQEREKGWKGGEGYILRVCGDEARNWMRLKTAAVASHSQRNYVGPARGIFFVCSGIPCSVSSWERRRACYCISIGKYLQVRGTTPCGLIAL